MHTMYHTQRQASSALLQCRPVCVNERTGSVSSLCLVCIDSLMYYCVRSGTDTPSAGCLTRLSRAASLGGARTTEGASFLLERHSSAR